ncbi:MAG: ABC transporter ATP-binding protein [Planctomycetota bacterium]
MSFLRLESLAKTWPDGTRAVLGADLSIEEGEFVVLLGPSGCGKTTTLRMIAGLEAPTSGRVLLDGRDVTALPPSRRDVGFVFQFYALYPHMSVEANVEFPLRCARVPRTERRAAVARVAERLQLEPLLRRRPRELAGGDQQRVALARAMVRKPALWLMDEPLGSLDSERRGEMCEFLRAHQLEQKVTTVYVTHDQDEAMRLADRVVVMSEGEIIQAGSPQTIYDEPRTLFVARFLGSPGMNLLHGEIRREHGFAVFRAQGSTAPLRLPTLSRAGPAVLGFRPERAHLDSEGPLEGRIAVEAFHGSCRYLHVDGGFGRIAVREKADRGGSAGDEVRVSIEQESMRVFDVDTGRRAS